MNIAIAGKNDRHRDPVKMADVLASLDSSFTFNKSVTRLILLTLRLRNPTQTIA